MPIKHKFVSEKADGTDATRVQPTGWNEDHEITGFLSKFDQLSATPNAVPFVDAAGNGALAPSTPTGRAILAIASFAALLTELAGAPLDSPVFTGAPRAPTPDALDNSTKLATTEFVRAAVAALVGSSPATLDTLQELADALGNDPDFAATTAAALGNRLRVDDNQGLSPMQQAQGLLNLGVIIGTAANNVLRLDAGGKLPAVDGSQLLGIVFEGALRFDQAQALAAAEKARAVANLSVDQMLGYRNKVINGNFDIWQRQTSQTSSGYGSDDRWSNKHLGSTKVHSREAFALGQTDVPGNPRFFSRTVVTSVAGAGNYVMKVQAIEDVRTLAGRKVTLTFYAKADAPLTIGVWLRQHFGTGGTPSTDVEGFGGMNIELSTDWQRHDMVFDVPSISGKALGTDDNSSLKVIFVFDDDTRRHSGTFDLARVSLVEGDASFEVDPFSPRHIQQEIELCERYYEKSYLLDTFPGANTPPLSNRGQFVGLKGVSDLFRLGPSFRVRKRAAPSVQIYNGATSGRVGTEYSDSIQPDQANIVSEANFRVNITVAAGSPWTTRAVGTPVMFQWTADAELPV